MLLIGENTPVITATKVSLIIDLSIIIMTYIVCIWKWRSDNRQRWANFTGTQVIPKKMDADQDVDVVRRKKDKTGAKMSFVTWETGTRKDDRNLESDGTRLTFISADGAATEFNLTGIKSKLAFDKTKMFSVIIGKFLKLSGKRLQF